MSHDLDSQQAALMRSNAEYVAQGSFMMRRIDTSDLMKHIKLFLNSTELLIRQNQAGDYYEDEVVKGKPLASDEGVMRICNIVSMVINTHNVQGNLKTDHYWYILERIRKEITESVVLNCYKWQIIDEDLNQIINTIMHLIELFLTRPVDNKERDSYSQVVRSHETIKEQNTGSLQRFTQGFK